MSNKWFTVEIARNRTPGAPPERVVMSGTDATDPHAFAKVIASVILAHREAEKTWGNDTDFGGDFIDEMVAELVTLLVPQVFERGGIWHFDSPEHAEREGYTDRVKAIEDLIAAAQTILALG